MNLAVVVQRYGADVNGGAELHARYIAERLAGHAQVRVLTTRARDYVTWRNALPAQETVNGLPVERFPVAHERDETRFGDWSSRVFTETHSLDDELRWLDSQGPYSPELIAHLRAIAPTLDFALFFSARYYHSYHGARAIPRQAILVPTAEREASLGLQIFPPVFRGVRAIMYNSFEERALIQALSGNHHVPGVVVGVGSSIPDRVEPERVAEAFGLRDPFVIYVGRIDRNKGCAELFESFLEYLAISARALDLVVVGTAVLPIPRHPRVRHLGYVSDADKFDLIAASRALVMPSYFESLSMVALEAWALGKPVLANAHCDVLLGQCLRSNAGLYYRDRAEFRGALDALLGDPWLAQSLGENGRRYYADHYAWPVIERKYMEMLEHLRADPPAHEMEALPGWLARRRRTLPPAAKVLESAPGGPSRERHQGMDETRRREHRDRVATAGPAS